MNNYRILKQIMSDDAVWYIAQVQLEAPPYKTTPMPWNNIQRNGDLSNDDGLSRVSSTSTAKEIIKSFAKIQTTIVKTEIIEYP